MSWSRCWGRWFAGRWSRTSAGFAEELLRRGYTQSSAGQHVCFLAHLDRWMSAEGIGLGAIERAGDRPVSGRSDARLGMSSIAR